MTSRTYTSFDPTAITTSDLESLEPAIIAFGDRGTPDILDDCIVTATENVRVEFQSLYRDLIGVYDTDEDYPGSPRLFAFAHIEDYRGDVKRLIMLGALALFMSRMAATSRGRFAEWSRDWKGEYQSFFSEVAFAADWDRDGFIDGSSEQSAGGRSGGFTR